VGHTRVTSGSSFRPLLPCSRPSSDRLVLNRSKRRSTCNLAIANLCRCAFTSNRRPEMSVAADCAELWTGCESGRESQRPRPDLLVEPDAWEHPHFTSLHLKRSREALHGLKPPATPRVMEAATETLAPSVRTDTRRPSGLRACLTIQRSSFDHGEPRPRPCCQLRVRPKYIPGVSGSCRDTRPSERSKHWQKR
jgi:hypothetical protein